MSGRKEATYTLAWGNGGGNKKTPLSDTHPEATEVIVPRIARLLALAIRLERLIRDETIRDYAEVARLGKVTRPRVTQIMKLLDLAPDIQEAILFLPSAQGLNERRLRPVAAEVDWEEQRRLFARLRFRSPGTEDLA